MTSYRNEIEAWVCAQLEGDADRAELRSRETVEVRDVARTGPTGGACQVERWRTSAGTVYLKQHPERRSFDQECHAYRAWVPALQESCPRLIAHDPDRRLLLLAELPGVIAARGESAESRSALPISRVELHERAGGWLHAWHALPFSDTDPLPLAEAARSRVATWVQRGEAVLAADEIAFVTDFVRSEASALEGESRVPCHRDFAERNWMVADDGELRVLDFEHAAPDHRLADLVRVAVGPWQQDPELRTAFLRGYGFCWDDRRERQLQLWIAIWSLSTIVWAATRGDTEFEQFGRAALETLRGEV